MTKTALRHFEQRSDEELISLCRNGEMKAFSIIVERHGSVVKRTALGMLGESPDVDEVTQDVFVRFYHALYKFRMESKLSTYLTRIAINLSLNVLKKRQKEVRRTVPIEKAEQVQEFDQTIDRTEQREMLLHAISQLDEEFKAVVVLRLVDGYSVQETADVLNIPPGTVASRLSRAQIKLRAILKSLQII